MPPGGGESGMGVTGSRQGCWRCGALDWAQARAAYRWRGAIVENVPALKCRACGEVVFDLALLADLEREVERLGVRGRVRFARLARPVVARRGK